MKLRKIIAAVAAAAAAVSMTMFSVSAEQVWSGSNDMGTSWDGGKAFTVEMPDASEGDEITVSFTCADGADYYNLQLCVGTEGWPKLTSPDVNEWGSIEVADMTSYTFKLNADDAAQIKESGMVVFGYAITVTSVDVNAGGAAAPAEEAPAADGDSAPAATGNVPAAAMAAVMAAAGAAAIASKKRK